MFTENIYINYNETIYLFKLQKTKSSFDKNFDKNLLRLVTHYRGVGGFRLCVFDL